ncbi:MAG: c-type cytochrome [Bryobacteraceae bacterium]|nr:c-type cytochrome [Bryobacteraceae bacterium]
MTAILFLALLQQAPAADRMKVDWERARKIYMANCAGCHGPEGRGGKGADLAVPKLRRAANDEQLFRIILGGIPGTEMPPSWYLGQNSVALVTAYVRKLGAAPDPVRTPGDPAKGKLVYASQSCAGCHDRGFGPPLDEIGIRRSLAHLRQSLEDPAAEVPEEFLMMRATTALGKQITGARLNEDTFTVQITDATGKLHSFRKAELKKLDRLPGASPMPSYKGTLSAAEIDDLVSFLAAQRGGR